MTCGSLWLPASSIGAPLECMVIGRRNIRRSSSNRDCTKRRCGSASCLDAQWRIQVSHEAMVEETRPETPEAKLGTEGAKHGDGNVLRRSNWSDGTASFSAMAMKQLYIGPDTTTICSVTRVFA